MRPKTKRRNVSAIIKLSLKIGWGGREEVI